MSSSCSSKPSTIRRRPFKWPRGSRKSFAGRSSWKGESCTCSQASASPWAAPEPTIPTTSLGRPTRQCTGRRILAGTSGCSTQRCTSGRSADWRWRTTSGEPWGMEALVRWDHPERGLLEPSQFVPVAEQSGLVIPMGEQILREACFRAKEWQEESSRIPPLVMSVNLSASQLSRLDLADTVEGVLGETGLEGNRLTLDVTETVYVKVLAGNTAMLDRLRVLGVRFSIDDFGTGYSSLSYLKRLPADAIKIDQSFVKGLGEDVDDTAVVRMIIELAHTLRLEIIAEGVETEEQATLLKEMGCDFAQGYHFSKPLPPEAMSW